MLKASAFVDALSSVVHALFVSACAAPLHLIPTTTFSSPRETPSPPIPSLGLPNNHEGLQATYIPLHYRHTPDLSFLGSIEVMSAGTATMFSLEGQTALITGGTRGIGQAAAIALAEAGADVILIQVYLSQCLP